ncbi:MAG: hypothetical protein IK000_09295 [Bacteroidaceae bacterium]|nr:hypothetical protein [Bacteroidaceae bacterium]
MIQVVPAGEDTLKRAEKQKKSAFIFSPERECLCFASAFHSFRVPMAFSLNNFPSSFVYAFTKAHVFLHEGTRVPS